MSETTLRRGAPGATLPRRRRDENRRAARLSGTQPPDQHQDDDPDRRSQRDKRRPPSGATHDRSALSAVSRRADGARLPAPSSVFEDADLASDPADIGGPVNDGGRDGRDHDVSGDPSVTSASRSRRAATMGGVQALPSETLATRCDDSPERRRRGGREPHPAEPQSA